MARSKKNETTMTLEEKLQQVLVSDWEWPYKLPENWCWVRLGALISSSKENTSNFSTDIKYVGLEHIEKDSGKIEYGSAENVKSLKNRFGAGQILYGKLRPYLNKHGIPTFDGVCSTDILVFDTQKITIAEYINFFFDTRDFLEYTISNSRGVNLPRVSETSILEAKCPLPPLPEQQRIVDRIESLFAKLDEAKEKAQATLDSFETRKAAILHKAFTGELTEQWRKENSISYNDHKRFFLKECCKIGSGGTPSRKVPDYYSGNIPWIKTGEINWNEITDAEERISESAIENSSAKLYAPGAVLVAMYGMGITRGRAAILQIPAATNQAVCVLIPSEHLLNKYLFYYFMCNYWEIREQAVGGNQLNLSATIIGRFEIDVPSIMEQHEIVRILDSAFSKEQQVQETAETVLEQIDLMKKAILSRAFRGELGTNDPTEESALELLKSILVDEKQEAPDKPSKRRIIIPNEVAALLSSNLEKELIKIFYKEDGDLVPMSRLMAVSSKKFEVIGTIKKLQQKGIIQKTDNGDFKLMR